MISSYLSLLKPSHNLVANELRQEKIRLTKETRFIENNTMDVILQSVRRARKLRPPKLPERLHVKNYKTVLHELFSFACELRFALAPFLMITTPSHASVLLRHDSTILFEALKPIVTLTKKYIQALVLKFNSAHYRIYIHGPMSQAENELLFSVIFDRIIPAKTVKGLRHIFDNLFNYCALPPDLYKIHTANEFISLGFFLPVPRDKILSSIVILLDQTGFPTSTFPRGWDVIGAQKELYYLTQPSSDNVSLSTADILSLSSIK